MDSTEERIDFENMPRILAELRKEIKDLKSLMLGKNDLTRLTEWMDVEELRDYLPGHPAKCTIYEWAKNGKIPHYRNGKLLYFFREEIRNWLRTTGDRK
jgi:excisionase family DNA binding protein